MCLVRVLGKDMKINGSVYCAYTVSNWSQEARRGQIFSWLSYGAEGGTCLFGIVTITSMNGKHPSTRSAPELTRSDRGAFGNNRHIKCVNIA